MSEFQKREDCNAVFARGHWVRQNERRFGMESFFSSSVDLPAVETGNSARVYFLAKVVFSFSWVFEVGNGKEGADFGLSCCDRLGNASYLLFNGTLCLTRGKTRAKQLGMDGECGIYCCVAASWSFSFFLKKKELASWSYEVLQHETVVSNQNTLPGLQMPRI